MTEKITGICCNDAGAAELISSYILHCKPTQKFIFSLKGPSIEIFEKKLGKLKLYSLDLMIEKSDQIFSGTGWSTEFEITGIKKARELGKYVIVFLDHWVNYKQRFKFKKDFFFPNEIWVSDTYAKNIALSIFTNIKIQLIKNYFLEDIKETYKKKYFSNKPEQKNINFLFLSDNNNSVIKSDFLSDRNVVCRDEDLAEYFLKNLKLLSRNIGQVVIRPHPSEVDTLIKYKAVFDKYNVLFIIGGKYNLLEEISNSDVVVGGDSMALVVSMACGKKTFTCAPPETKFFLPFVEIKKIREIKRME
ncbi:hypothetical protein OAD30_02900 [Alphaproteobacteria bacterium]|nr:hypothetical protein [Alphaproteobacteria bacterium]